MNTIEEFLQHYSSRVKKNVEIVTPDSLSQDFFLHIDKKTALNYYPKVSERAMVGEDRTVPRVTVGATLENCLQGYASGLEDFLNLDTETYKVNKVNFEVALKPNNKLVPDTDDSNEYWLVTHRQEYNKYKPIEIGTFFTQRVIATGKNNDKKRTNEYVGDCYLEIISDDKVRLNDKVIVSTGCYVLKVLYPYGIIETSKPISKKEYDSVKKKTISTENIKNEHKYKSW